MPREAFNDGLFLQCRMDDRLISGNLKRNALLLFLDLGTRETHNKVNNMILAHSLGLVERTPFDNDPGREAQVIVRQLAEEKAGRKSVCTSSLRLVFHLIYSYIVEVNLGQKLRHI